MPDLTDAKRQLAEALTEAGALPQWEDVTRDGAPHCNLQRIRVDGGWLYGINRCPHVFVPAEPGGMADLKSRFNTAMATVLRLESERDEARKQLHRIEDENGRLLGQVQSLQDALAAARAAADEWAAIARDVAGKPPAPTAEPCPRRAPANVGPSAFVMRGCTLPEGHQGPCEAR